MSVGGEPDLLAALGRPHPWALDLNAPAAERYLASGAAVAVGRALSVVAAPRARDLLDLVLHRLAQDGEPGAGRQREQPLLGGARDLRERDLHLLGQRLLGGLRRRDDLDGV